MKFGRRPKPFASPEGYPDLTELQAAMLTKIWGEAIGADMLYARFYTEHVLVLPQGVRVSTEGRRAALYIAQSIAGIQRLVASTGVLFLPTLPPELNPAGALANLNRTAYLCVLVAADDTVPEAIPTVEERHSLNQVYGHQWHRTVSQFGVFDDARLGELLAEAGAAL